MSFESTYQLVAPLSETPDGLAYKALIKMTGEEVWIHIIRTDAQGLFEMAKKHFGGGGFGEKPILEVVQEGAKAYIVTRPLPAGATLRDWLVRLEQTKTPDSMQATGAFQFEGFGGPAASKQSMMATQEIPAFVMPPAPVAPPVMPQAAVAAPPAAPATGEFTQMFQQPAVAAPAVPTPAAPPVQEAGEFTRMFKAQNPVGPAEPVAPPPVFTPPPVAVPPPVFAPVPQSAPPKPTGDPGEFTRMFQSPLMESTPAPVNPILTPIAPPPTQQAGEFTRMFKSVEPSGIMPSSAPPPPPPAPAAGPGDFTRLLQTPSFGGGTASQAPSAMQPPAPAPAPGAPPQGAPFGGIVSPGSVNAPSVSGPSFTAPSVGLSGGMNPSFNPGHMHGPSVSGQVFSAPSIRPQSLGGGNFSLDNLPGFGGASPADGGPVAPPPAGPLSGTAGPMNPAALSSGDGATAFFRAPAVPQPQQAPGAPVPGGPGDFTRMMQAPPPASAPAVGVPVPKSNTPAPAAAPLFSKPVAPAAGAPAAAPAAEPPAKGGFLKGISPWMIIGNIVIILMVVLLIYVILKSSR